MTEGGCEEVRKRAVSLPRMLMSSSWTILTICSEGESAVVTWVPRARSRMCVDDFGDDGEGDVGLDEGEADLAQGLGDVLVGDGALAAEGLEGALEFVA